MINRVILLGRVDHDPKISPLPNNGRVANFGLVTQEKWRDGKTGEERSRHERHKIAVFSEKHIDMVMEKIKAGTSLYLEGVLEGRSWTDQQGHRYESVDVVLRPNKGAIVVMDAGDSDAPRTDR